MIMCILLEGLAVKGTQMILLVGLVRNLPLKFLWLSHVPFSFTIWINTAVEALSRAFELQLSEWIYSIFQNYLWKFLKGIRKYQNQNHRMIEVRRDIQGPSSPTPLRQTGIRRLKLREMGQLRHIKRLFIVSWTSVS